MKKHMLSALALFSMALLTTRAENVTVHNTIGLLDAQLVTKTIEPVGTVEVWNTRMDFNLVITPSPGLALSKVYIFLDGEPAPAPTVGEDGEVQWIEPEYGDWPYTVKFKKFLQDSYVLSVKLADLKYLQWGQWGEPWLQKRLVTVAVRVQMRTVFTDPQRLAHAVSWQTAAEAALNSSTGPHTFTAWALNPYVPIDVQRTAWGENTFAFRYELQHPKHTQFVVDGPVNGLGYRSRTHEGTTGVDGGAWYYPGEDIAFSIGDLDLGYAKADERVTPLDIFPNLEISDAPVANVARLLLSLDADPGAQGSIQISEDSMTVLQKAMAALLITSIDFADSATMDALLAKIAELGAQAGLPFTAVSATDAVARLEQALGNSLLRRNISKSPEYAVDKPKLDIVPIWVPARKADGTATVVEYKDKDGNVIENRDKVKPLIVTYTEEQDNTNKGMRRASDIITAVSLDDGATWKRFNVSHMAGHSSFTLGTGEKFPGDSRAPQQKIAEDKILVVWDSAYARGGKPRVAIKTVEQGDTYPYDDAYAVRDLWGVRGRQGSVNYDLDDDVADQGIGEIPYHAMWACRGVLVWEGNWSQYPGRAIGDIVWFKPERLTTGRRDAFLAVVGSAKNVGFGIAWQEDPGGLRPGKCSAGGHGWSGATVHKKTDIWYSFIKYADFALIDANFVTAEHSSDEHAAELGEDTHSQQPEISSRPKWLVPMSLPVRVSDNNTVNTENMRVQLDENGLPVVVDGSFVPLAGAEEEDWVRHEREHDAECGGGDGVVTEDEDHDGEGGTGGGWGMARYAYQLSFGTDPVTGQSITLADQSGANIVWDGTVYGEFRPGELPGCRWYRFINQPGRVKTVAITPDGRVLDGDTGACRPNLTIMPGGWALLGYEETKGLGTPPEEDHHLLDTVDVVTTSVHDPDDDEFGEKGKDVIYHSFPFDQPDMISAGNVVNLPALDDQGNLVPVFYKDANGNDTSVIRQYANENARRVRFIAQAKSDMLKTPGADTVAFVIYKQGREGNGKPSDIFGVRVVVPAAELNTTSKANPYRFQNFVRYGSGADTSDPSVMRYQRRHMNMTSATIEAVDPLDLALDYQGHVYGKVLRWNQYAGNLSDESFANPYSDSKGHRGFLRGNQLVLGYSFTPNWGRLGGDHLDFYVRRSFDGGRSWTTDPKSSEDTEHTVIERDLFVRGVYHERKVKYGPGQPEPGRNVSLLKGNRFTVTDPRLVPPMGPGTVNPTFAQDDTYNPDVYYVVFGTAEVIHGLADPMATDTVKADIFYTRTADSGTTWLMEPWVINPNSASPEAGETVYRFPVMAQGTPHQGHAQIRMHPSGTRLYTIWHQFTDGDELHVSPHDVGNDIWFRRIDFMSSSD